MAARSAAALLAAALTLGRASKELLFEKSTKTLVKY